MSTTTHPSADAPGKSGFTPTNDGTKWRFDGKLTFDNVSGVYASSKLLPLPTQGLVDLSGLAHADSSALAVLLALMRRAAAEGRSLTLAAIPEKLTALARVYGIDGLLAASGDSRNAG